MVRWVAMVHSKVVKYKYHPDMGVDMAVEADSHHDSANLETISGKKFTEGGDRYVPLRNRTPTDAVERALKDVDGVIDVVTCATSEFVHYKGSEADVDEIHNALREVFDEQRVVRKDRTMVRARYSPADYMIEFAIR